MAPTPDGRKIAKAVTSMVAVGAVGAAGLGSVALYGTITAAAASKASTTQGSTTPGPGSSGSSSDPGLRSGSTSGTQLLPGNGGPSLSRSAGS
ncbi:hypothetical protein [Arthrobacter sp. SDTb3-6]|uniref:hypothetical protein n=1 Tax=Arthrobacter sp. SDTb3-6 TaxID=2713571 RepID=UPI00159DC388|nr:hypothetical protein [Arthrobacter sp. SDTb3-6]NVM98273.1 hypothetical protein [Arthrobacter sp. SDTb3-6]